MTYQLRRLRLHSPIERIPHTHRYRLTDLGLSVALFTRTYDHLLRPGLGAVLPPDSACNNSLRRAFDNTSREVDRWIRQVGAACDAFSSTVGPQDF
jgi:hypothetical protein